MTAPYYSDDLAQLWCADFRDVPEWLGAAVLLTDPPYGIGYRSGSRRDTLAASIVGVGSTGVAAKMLGRRVLLVECDERYCEIAAKRLAATAALPFDDEAAS